MNDYADFLKSKSIRNVPSGFDADESTLNPMLFDWQKKIVRWSLNKGRSAIFEDCGLGKTAQQLIWAENICSKENTNVLILAPLAVSIQTQREGKKFGIPVNVANDYSEVKKGINITNYEKLHKFDPQFFNGIVLDESSILKSFSGKYRNDIINAFQQTKYKLACTATPAPNDFVEIGNHAEFLGVMSRTEMLSMFFINDTGNTGTWRLKGHVEKNIFWRWLASWSVMLRFPSDIGFDDNGFILPELNTAEHIIPYTGKKDTLFVEPASTLTERRQARKESIADRVAYAAEKTNKSNDQWLVWCNLNDESAMLSKSINDAVEIKGSDSPKHKEQSMIDFQDRKIKVLVTKPRIAGFGMNFQNCHNMAFVGLSDSFEQYYQAVRRCWRFGQKEQVNAHIIISEKEGSVLSNIKRKQKDADNMYQNMIRHMSRFVKDELRKTSKTFTDYKPSEQIKIPSFLGVAA